MPDTVTLPLGSPLRDLAFNAPALVIFLRSFGCTFCREAMADVAAVKSAIRDDGAGIAFVHGGAPSEAAPWFTKYDLDDVMRVSDPSLAHYRAFELDRTNAQALLSPTVWTRGAMCAMTHGFGPQSPELLRQLPGVFVMQGDRILTAYRHRLPADRPNYLSLVRAARRSS